MSPRSAGPPWRTPSTEAVVGEVERVGDGLAAVRADLGGDVLAACRSGARRARPGSRPRPSLSAVAAPMPDEAPVTTAGRRSGWAYFCSPSAHRRPRGRQRGEAAHVERVHPPAAGRGRPRVGGPRSTSSSARRGPRAGPAWRRGRSAGRRRRTGSARARPGRGRCRSRSGAAKTRSSRLAEPTSRAAACDALRRDRAVQLDVARR